MHTVRTSDFSDCGRERIVGHFGWNWQKPVSRTFQDWSQDGHMHTEGKEEVGREGCQGSEDKHQENGRLVSKFYLCL